MRGLNYQSILSAENTTKSLSYEMAIKEYAAKKCGKKSTMEVCQQLVYTNIMLLFWIL
jgi:hypothetical protein